jgi:hypothetical protein
MHREGTTTILSQRGGVVNVLRAINKATRRNPAFFTPFLATVPSTKAGASFLEQFQK